MRVLQILCLSAPAVVWGAGDKTRFKSKPLHLLIREGGDLNEILECVLPSRSPVSPSGLCQFTPHVRCVHPGVSVETDNTMWIFV